LNKNQTFFIDIKIQIDDYFELYIGDKFIMSGNKTNTEYNKIKLPILYGEVISIYAIDYGGDYEISASFSPYYKGLSTDFKCQGTQSNQSEWFKNDLNDANWPNALKVQYSSENLVNGSDFIWSNPYSNKIICLLHFKPK
jgi:hypothetical protein